MRRFSSFGRKEDWGSLPAQLLIVCLLFSMISISLEQIFLYLAIILWAIKLLKEKASLAFPKFFLPLLIFAGLSLVSSAFSVNPGMSFWDSRELVTFLIIPLSYAVFSRAKEIERACYSIWVSAAVSMLYSFHRYFFKAAAGERIKGFMGHYMTQAGLLVLFISLALSLFLFQKGKVRFLWGGSFVLSLFALALTLTRSAWIGAAVAACVIIFLYKPKAVLLLPVLAGLVYLASPPALKQRAASIFSLEGYSNRLRVEYIKAGVKIIRDYPLLGTGPDTVDMVFQHPKYGLSRDARQNVHLHNNFVQIAAERGLPALLAWLTFVGWAFVSLAGLLRNKSSGVFPLAAASLAALSAMVVSGFFEYNFGDSEITLLFLFILTMPFAMARMTRSPGGGNGFSGRAAKAEPPASGID
ncbi:MAG: O-antigen ligase family protein [Acidobacteriota bacterium]|nr:O-antigen ligase family protein [Acidobacteriota bacterium]